MVSDNGKLCDLNNLRNFGAIDAATTNDVGVRKEIDLIRDLFGPQLDLVIADEENNPQASRCQQAVLKQL